MFLRRLLAALPPLLALALAPAWADVYTWVDASGQVTYSNLPPPAGVKVLEVVRGAAPGGPTPAEQAAAEREAEVRALAERVRQLEAEAAPGGEAPPPPLRTARAAPPTEQNVECPPPWSDCIAPGWAPWMYPSVVVTGSPRGHHHKGHRGDGRRSDGFVVTPLPGFIGAAPGVQGRDRMR